MSHILVTLSKDAARHKKRGWSLSDLKYCHVCCKYFSREEWMKYQSCPDCMKRREVKK